MSVEELKACINCMREVDNESEFLADICTYVCIPHEIMAAAVSGGMLHHMHEVPLLSLFGMHAQAM